MKKRIIGFFSLSILLIIFSFYPITMLTVSSEHSIDYIFLMKEGSPFSIRWIHSVEEEEWEEFFVIREGTIYLDSTRFKTFGAGVPHNAGTDSFLKDGWLYMVNINRFIGELYVRAGSDTNHRLIVNETIYTLSNPAQEVAYFFEVGERPFIFFIKNYICTKLGCSS